MNSDPATDYSIAGAAITVAMLETLMRRDVISRGDGLAILEAAQKRCATIPGSGAAQILGDLEAKMRAGNY